MKLTKAQKKALDTLREGHYISSQNGGYSTGINSTILENLRKKGLIKCKTIYLAGFVSEDFEILV